MVLLGSYCECGGVMKLSEKHDARYCAEEDKWLEPMCSDRFCEYCHNRPSKPSMEVK